jgi:hypothetical protein
VRSKPAPKAATGSRKSRVSARIGAALSTSAVTSA